MVCDSVVLICIVFASQRGVHLIGYLALKRGFLLKAFLRHLCDSFVTHALLMTTFILRAT